ncbi:MAG: VWA domain-containing protein [bacterium]
MKKNIYLLSIFFLVFLFLYLTPILNKSGANKTFQFCQALIPSEISSFSNKSESDDYHNIKNLSSFSSEPTFNIYNTPNDYDPQEINNRENVLIILDCSYSMDDEVRGKRKIDIARDVINDVLGQLPKNINLGFRVYGQKDGGLFGIDGCKATELMVPIGYKTQNAISAKLKNIDAVGWTPICYSLDKSISTDFIGISGSKRIILVSDGMDTCGGSPCDFAVNLMKRRTDVTIDVIGFDIRSEPSAISQLKCTALATHGKFYTADNSAEFTKSLKNSLNIKKEVEGKIFSK